MTGPRNHRWTTTLACGIILIGSISFAEEPPLQTGPWRAWLDSPGGQLPFGIEFVNEGINLRAWLINSPERIEVPRVEWDGPRLVLGIDHYDSTIQATLSRDGTRLDGQWIKRPGMDKTVKMTFHAEAGAAPRFARSSANPAERLPSVAGRWSVKFSKSNEPAVAQVAVGENGDLTGTFMTTTGDYRFLAGTVDGSRLQLSVFDGGHAFLFDARVGHDGMMQGDFWSSDTWHETWVAHRDPKAQLPSAYEMTKSTGPANLNELVYLDLEGNKKSLADVAGDAKVIIIEVFGSWCPNCHDAADFLVELDTTYRSRGLAVVGLAFEISEDFKRDARQVRRFGERHKIKYPLLLGGKADKETVALAIPVIDKLRSYPTAIVMDASGQVLKVHTGFSGPATGQAYQELRSEYKKLLETLLRS